MIDEKKLNDLFGISIERTKDEFIMKSYDFEKSFAAHYKSYVSVQEEGVTIKGRQFGNVYYISLENFLNMHLTTYLETDEQPHLMIESRDPNIKFKAKFTTKFEDLEEQHRDYNVESMQYEASKILLLVFKEARKFYNRANKKVF
jgi:PHD/YefM family antitoxin component YafN of YafNO toxin-antitoxin module